MALIKERNKGRSDGGYTRLFGIENLGALISQVHATSISAGTELEKLICKAHTQPMDISMLTDFLKGDLPHGTYLIPKKIIQRNIKDVIKSDAEPDFLIIVIIDKIAYVVEIKDGDAFDTKKSAGEIASCKDFASKLSAYFLNIKLDYKVKIKICCFNQDSPEKIIEGFKGQLKKSEVWTGRNLCNKLGISYETIIDKRKVHQTENLEFFIDSLLSIDSVGSMIKKKLADSALIHLFD